MIRRDYTANGGWETFISYEDPELDVLIGLLRLRKCSPQTFRPELKGRVSIVRELHVYGSVVPVRRFFFFFFFFFFLPGCFALYQPAQCPPPKVSSRDPAKFQHQGFGTLLMEEAERIAREEHGSVKIAVISGSCCCIVCDKEERAPAVIFHLVYANSFLSQLAGSRSRYPRLLPQAWLRIGGAVHG